MSLVSILRTFSRIWVHRPPAPKEAEFTERFRSRNAFKLLELNDRYQFLTPGLRVLDLGCSPGGWSEVASNAVQSSESKILVYGVDIKSLSGLPGCRFITADISETDSHTTILTEIKDPVDIVLSDLSQTSSKDPDIDSEISWSYCLDTLSIANYILRPGGTILCRMLYGVEEPSHFETIKSYFETAQRIRANAYSKNSREIFYFCKGWKTKKIHYTELTKEELKTTIEQAYAAGVKSKRDLVEPEIETMIRGQIGDFEQDNPKYAFLKDEDESLEHYAKVKGNPSFNVEIPESLDQMSKLVKKWKKKKAEAPEDHDEVKDQEEYDEMTSVEVRKMIKEMMETPMDFNEEQFRAESKGMDVDEFMEQFEVNAFGEHFGENKVRIHKGAKERKHPTHEFDDWDQASKDLELWDN